jgi:hypothetical protein
VIVQANHSGRPTVLIRKSAIGAGFQAGFEVGKNALEPTISGGKPTS